MSYRECLPPRVSERLLRGAGNMARRAAVLYSGGAGVESRVGMGAGIQSPGARLYYRHGENVNVKVGASGHHGKLNR